MRIAPLGGAVHDDVRVVQHVVAACDPVMFVVAVRVRHCDPVRIGLADVRYVVVVCADPVPVAGTHAAADVPLGSTASAGTVPHP